MEHAEALWEGAREANTPDKMENYNVLGRQLPGALATFASAGLIEPAAFAVLAFMLFKQASQAAGGVDSAAAAELAGVFSELSDLAGELDQSDMGFDVSDLTSTPDESSSFIAEAGGALFGAGAGAAAGRAASASGARSTIARAASGLLPTLARGLRP